MWSCDHNIFFSYLFWFFSFSEKSLITKNRWALVMIIKFIYFNFRSADGLSRSAESTSATTWGPWFRFRSKVQSLTWSCRLCVAALSFYFLLSTNSYVKLVIFLRVSTLGNIYFLFSFFFFCMLAIHYGLSTKWRVALLLYVRYVICYHWGVHANMEILATARTFKELKTNSFRFIE